MATQPAATMNATVRDLAEELPCLPLTASLGAVADLCLADEAHDWLVLVDDEARPVRLVERAALLQGEPFEHRLLAVDEATPIEGAMRQVLAIEPQQTQPLACYDAAGRYRGLVRVDRMLALLARPDA